MFGESSLSMGITVMTEAGRGGREGRSKPEQ